MVGGRHLSTSYSPTAASTVGRKSSQDQGNDSGSDHLINHALPNEQPRISGPNMVPSSASANNNIRSSSGILNCKYTVTTTSPTTPPATAVAAAFRRSPNGPHDNDINVSGSGGDDGGFNSPENPYMKHNQPPPPIHPMSPLIRSKMYHSKNTVKSNFTSNLTPTSSEATTQPINMTSSSRSKWDTSPSVRHNNRCNSNNNNNNNNSTTLSTPVTPVTTLSKLPGPSSPLSTSSPSSPSSSSSPFNSSSSSHAHINSSKSLSSSSSPSKVIQYPSSVNNSATTSTTTTTTAAAAAILNKNSGKLVSSSNLSNLHDGNSNNNSDDISSSVPQISPEMMFIIREQAKTLAAIDKMTRRVCELEIKVRDMMNAVSQMNESSSSKKMEAHKSCIPNNSSKRNEANVISDDSGGEYSRATTSSSGGASADDDELLSLLTHIAKMSDTIKSRSQYQNQLISSSSPSSTSHIHHQHITYAPVNQSPQRYIPEPIPPSLPPGNMYRQVSTNCNGMATVGGGFGLVGSSSGFGNRNVWPSQISSSRVPNQMTMIDTPLGHPNESSHSFSALLFEPNTSRFLDNLGVSSEPRGYYSPLHHPSVSSTLATMPTNSRLIMSGLNTIDSTHQHHLSDPLHHHHQQQQQHHQNRLNLSPLINHHGSSDVGGDHHHHTSVGGVTGHGDRLYGGQITSDSSSRMIRSETWSSKQISTANLHNGNQNIVDINAKSSKDNSQ
ncbi:uncharacterized protein LOC141851965 [Brevipalpus obovatus]|uniref:uncharacterized protein LOC141851965 n=1 Tax=Brevipalpus obovatus TaxID=246614 RepID=UPI003D9E2F83